MKNLGFVILAVMLVGCGKKDNQSTAAVTSPGVTVIPGGEVLYTGATPPAIQGSYPYFYVNYRVTEGTCDTGLRRFSGNNFYYVKNLMCQSLLNDWMNQRCGRAQRQAWYNAICQGW